MVVFVVVVGGVGFFYALGGLAKIVLADSNL